MTLADYQFSYNGLVIGDATLYELLEVDGADAFQARLNDEELPSSWGALAGAALVDVRTITLIVEMVTSHAVSQPFERAFVPPSQYDPVALLPLTWKMPDRPELLVMCRVVRRGRPRNFTTEIGVTQWAVQLSAPDPRLYASDLSQTTASPYLPDSEALESSVGSGADAGWEGTASSGADAAFDFGGIVGGGTVFVTNDGNTDTFPTFTFSSTSTLDAWTVINDTTGEEASFVVSLLAGQQLVANMAALATGITDPAVTLNGESRYSAWQVPREPIRLVPGTNSLRFIVTSGPTTDPSCVIAWRDAWI